MNQHKTHWRSIFERLATHGAAEHELVGVKSAANSEFIKDSVQKIIGPVRNLRMLDAGSGEAQISRRYFPSNQVVCMDFSIAVLRRISPGYWGKLSADLEFLPFNDETFDLVMCIETLQCLPSMEQVLNQFSRVLKPGGRLILSTLNSQSIMRRALRIIRPGRFHTILRSPYEVSDSLRRSGFEPPRILYLTHYVRVTTNGHAALTFSESMRSIAATNFILDARKSSK